MTDGYRKGATLLPRFAFQKFHRIPYYEEQIVQFHLPIRISWSSEYQKGQGNCILGGRRFCIVAFSHA